MKALSCPKCGAPLPDAGAAAHATCKYCSTTIDLGKPEVSGPKVSVRSDVALSKRSHYERKGKHLSVEMDAHEYAGIFSTKAEGPFTELRIGGPEGGAPSVFVRSDSSEGPAAIASSDVSQAGNPAQEVPDLPSAMAQVADDLRKVAASAGLPVGVIAVTILVLLLTCCLAVTLFALAPPWK